MPKGQLILVPTPISLEWPLDPHIVEQLQKAQGTEGSLFVFEEPKSARRRWLSWGLSREQIEKFVYYNEHTRDQELDNLIQLIKGGKTVYLMSDCGLPAFCDPGQRLVDQAHRSGLRITALSFSNSVALAIALSGFEHRQFVFQGFLPRDKDSRKKALINCSKEKRVQIVMDTPYRLKKLLQELDGVMSTRFCMLALDLGKETELLLRGSPSKLGKTIPDDKREFVLVISGVIER